MFFLELSCFFYDPTQVGNMISGFSAFSKSSWISGISQFTYCWSLAWKVLNISLLECEMSAIVWYFEHSLTLPFFSGWSLVFYVVYFEIIIFFLCQLIDYLSFLIHSLICCVVKLNIKRQYIVYCSTISVSYELQIITVKKIIYFCFINYAKVWLCGSQQIVENS